MNMSPKSQARIKVEMGSENIPLESPRVRALSDPPPSSEIMKSRSGSFRNTFEMEPNPFEQSFSIPASTTRSTAVDKKDADKEGTTAKPLRRARSQSPAGGTRTPGAGRLAPLSSIASPQVTGGEMHHLGWQGLEGHALRSGPLSPSILHGPTPGSVGFSFPSSFFDPSAFRTGLTPSVTGAPSHPHGLLAPPSPATAAMFAMMTNQTESTQAPGQHGYAAAAGIPSERDMPNQFELGFGKALQRQQHPLPESTIAPTAVTTMAPGSAMTTAAMHPALMAAHQGMFATQPAPKPMPMMGSPLKHGTTLPMAFPTSFPGLPPGIVHPSQLNGLPYSGPPGQNPLYLLSQSAQELAGVNPDDDAIAAGVLSNLNALPAPYGTGTSANGAAPAIVPVNPVQPSLSSKTSVQANSISTRAQSAAASGKAKPVSSPAMSESGSPDSTLDDSFNQIPTAHVMTTATGRKRKAAYLDEDLIDVPPPSQRGRKKGSGKKNKVDDDGNPLIPETEEEKRANFLERNRQAALKCRQRKKAWLQQLQHKVEFLTADNETLQATVNALREEISSLRTVLVAHKDCPVAIANGVNGQNISTISSFLQQQGQREPARLI